MEPDETVLGRLVVVDDVTAGDVIEVVMDRASGTVRGRRYRPEEFVASLTWPCMICREWRPDAVIGVTKIPVTGYEDVFPGGLQFNVRHCTDREECVTAAAEFKAPGSPRAT